MLESIELPAEKLEAALERERAANAVLREALEICLGHLTGGLDGNWADCDPATVARQALSSNPGAGVMEERDRYRDALQEIARSNCAGYILRGKEDRDELVELISEFYNEMRKRVQTAKDALNGDRDADDRGVGRCPNCNSIILSDNDATRCHVCGRMVTMNGDRDAE